MTIDENTIPILFLIGFPPAWFMMSHFIASQSGWKALAAAYPVFDDFGGDKKFMQSAGFGGHSLIAPAYSRILTVGANGQGVYFAVFILFRAGHTPFFVPYEELSGKERKVMFMSYVTLTPAKEPALAITINRRLARWIEERSNGNWSFE